MKQQKSLLLLLTILITLYSSAAAAKSSKKEKCLKTRAKIESIHNKMRNEYSAKQGAKYRKKLNKLYREEFKYCF